MAAATTSEAKVLLAVPYVISTVQLSVLTSDQNEDVSHQGPSGRSPFLVLPMVTAAATSGDQVTAEWVRASDSTSNDTVRVKARVASGGDISGAKLTVLCFFSDQASAGLSAP